MKKLESSLTNMLLVLTGVAVVMGGILAYVNHLTEGPIAEQKKQKVKPTRAQKIAAGEPKPRSKKQLRRDAKTAAKA